MVFIHGGGFVIGSSADYTNPSRFVAKDVVFVSVNYRLGPLGFLALPDSDGLVGGNMGLKGKCLVPLIFILQLTFEPS